MGQWVRVMEIAAAGTRYVSTHYLFLLGLAGSNINKGIQRAETNQGCQQ
jgi:hypothetical protein